jgi:vacuolar-type H+-ATPase subunit E/Vma4
VITIEGVKNMESKMLTKAKSEADKNLASAKEEVSSIKKENKKRLEMFSNEEREKIESEVKSLITKELASAQMEARRFFLDEREKIINDIINQSLENVRDDKSYGVFIERNIKEFSLDLGKKFKILCNKKDMSLIKKTVDKLGLDVSLEEENITSGIILIGSGLRVNLSIEALLDEKIRTIRQKILEIIEK